MTSTTEPKARTITLTGRAPVRIREDAWPVIAAASWDHYDNQYEFQANRKAAAQIKVRRHKDGRTIVYGTYRYQTSFRGEDDVRVAGGELLAAADGIPAAIYRTVDYLAAYQSLPDGWQPDWRLLADDAIADLPAAELA